MLAALIDAIVSVTGCILASGFRSPILNSTVFIPVIVCAYRTVIKIMSHISRYTPWGGTCCWLGLTVILFPKLLSPIITIRAAVTMNVVVLVGIRSVPV